MDGLRVRATATPPEAAAPATGAAPDVRFAPWIGTTRDAAFPVILSLSLVVHACVLLPSLLRQGAATPPPPREIPVEILQLPPKPPTPVQKPVSSKPEPPKPAPKAAQPPPASSKPVRPKDQPKPKPAPRAPTKISAKPTARSLPRTMADKQLPKPPPQPDAQNVAARLQSLLGPMPVIALPGASDTGTEAVSYSQLVLSKVAKAKREGRYRGIPGAASVAFTVGDSGEVAKVEIVRPSGDPSLDAEAIAMINRGAPYPVPPPGARRDYTITLRFEPLI